jgi:hypothetical protein
MKHPMQPIDRDESGTLRFKPNAIVRYLLLKAGSELDDPELEEFSQEDREQFAQLLGCSLAAFGAMSCASAESYVAASKSLERGTNELEIRNQQLREELAALRAGLREPIARLYRLEEDVLHGL